MTKLVTVYQRTTKYEYYKIDYVWGSIALLTLEVYNRVQINEYAAVITYPYFFVYCVNNLAGPIPAPHTIRFVVRSDELLN